MAFKDWVKTRTNEEGSRWENDKENKVVFVHTLFPHPETDYRGARTKTHIGTEFQDWNKTEGKRIVTKDFKTKSQAMAHAKSYMRSN